jgi:SAM-dependent methyltransferase
MKLRYRLCMLTRTPSPQEAIAANRAAWDASARYHRDNPLWRKLVESFAKPGHICFDPVMTEALRTVGVLGRDVAQVCCNNGRETVSLANMGARSATGFDQSERFLDQARELAAIAGQDISFVATDVNQIPARYRASFDLVVITIGVFGWMPDIHRFMAEVTSLLRPRGHLLVYEEHPVVNMFEPTSDTPLTAVHSYFSDRPFISDKAIIYDDSPKPVVPEHYWYVHPLSEVFTAMIGNGLTIQAFREYGHNIGSADFEPLEGNGRLLPLSYTLRAKKIV